MKIKVKIQLVNMLAAQIRRINPAHNRSTSMKLAYATLRQIADAYAIQFTKLSGQTERRVVCARWFDLQPPKGGKSNVKPGQILFADLGKYAAGSPNCIITTYQYQKV
jgi:hypothetical protein